MRLSIISISAFKKKFAQDFAKFLLIGISSQVLNFLVFFFLTQFTNTSIFYSSIYSSASGIINTFYLSKIFLADKKDTEPLRVLVFFIYYPLMVLVVGYLIDMLANGFMLNKFAAWFFVNAMFAVINFLFVKFIAFRF